MKVSNSCLCVAAPQFQSNKIEAFGMVGALEAHVSFTSSRGLPKVVKK